MALCINQSGTYRNITTLCINQSGTYRNITCGSGRINQSGTYRKFIGAQLLLGDTTGGGIMICAAGGTRWIVSPSDAQVSRNWYDKEDSNTRAQQVSGVGGWFIPSVAQLQNPGFCCRTYWNPAGTTYWSSQERSDETDTDQDGCVVRMGDGGVQSENGKGFENCVRSFRCVTY